MKTKQTTALWGSISVLIGVVIAILALARGTLAAALLCAAFAVWAAWAVITQFLPARRAAQASRQAEKAAPSDEALARTLLCHVNYRVSGCLKAAWPEAKWEWMMRDPAKFAAQGGTGRIRVYGVPDYKYADVTLDRNGKLSCSLVALAPVRGPDQGAAQPGQRAPDPRVWYETRGRDTLGVLIADLDSRGHRSLAVCEDGSVRVLPDKSSGETTQGALPDFPAKACWPRLAEALEQDGLAAAVRDDRIAVSW